MTYNHILLRYHGNRTNEKLSVDQWKPDLGHSSSYIWYLSLACLYTKISAFGKDISLKKPKQLQQYTCIDIFSKHNLSKEEFITSGGNALVLVSIYGGKPCEILDSLFYRRFCEKIVQFDFSGDKVGPPITMAAKTAAKLHSLTVQYQQVQLWRGKKTLHWNATSIREAAENDQMLLHNTDYNRKKCSYRKVWHRVAPPSCH